MINRITKASVLIPTIFGALAISPLLQPQAVARTKVLIPSTKPVASSGCIGDCNTDSLLYICIVNKTKKPVHVKGENSHSNFYTHAKSKARYWWWFRRSRNAERKLVVWLNGKKYHAKYNWTAQTPEQLGPNQACFFNKWVIKENGNGKLTLTKKS